MKVIYCIAIYLFFLLSLLDISCSTPQNDAERIIAIADSCDREDNPLQALQYYIKGFIAAKNESNEYLAMRCAGHISILYNSFGNVEGSLQYNKIGYELSTKLNAIEAKSAFLTNFVTFCCNNHDSVSARKYYAELIRIKMPKGRKEYEYFCLYEHARIMKCVGNYAKAIQIHRQALEYAEKNQLSAVYVLFQNSEIGNLMIEQHEYSNAVDIGKLCLNEALRIRNKELILNSYKMLADAYVGLGNKNEAYEYLEKYHRQNNGVYNMPKFFSLQNNLYKFETEEHERRISNLTVGIAVIAALSAVLVLLLFVIVKKNRALLKAQMIVVSKDMELIKLENSNTRDKTIPDSRQYSIPVDQKNELYNKIKQLFESHAVISDVDFSIIKMAELLDSNVKYVSMVINEKYGKSFKNVLNEYRVKEACRMLSDKSYGHYTIKSIYENVGYRNAASFIRAFKNVMGMTPSIYQKISCEKI